MMLNLKDKDVEDTLKGKAVRYLRLPTVDYTGAPIQLTQAKSGDTNSRYFSITLYDDRGEIDLSNYSIVELTATLPDETVQYYEGDIKENVVYVKLTSSMLSMSGRLNCDISLQGMNSNGECVSLTSQTFYVNVSRSQNCDNEGRLANENHKTLITLVNEVRELKSQLVHVKEKANQTVDDLLNRAKIGEFNGKDGQDGIHGNNGQDGQDGADGKNGRDGKDGLDGAGFTLDAILTFICEDDEEYSFALMEQQEGYCKDVEEDCSDNKCPYCHYCGYPCTYAYLI